MKTIDVKKERRLRELQGMFPAIEYAWQALANAINCEQRFDITRIWKLQEDSKLLLELAELLEQKELKQLS